LRRRRSRRRVVARGDGVAVAAVDDAEWEWKVAEAVNCRKGGRRSGWRGRERDLARLRDRLERLPWSTSLASSKEERMRKWREKRRTAEKERIVGRGLRSTWCRTGMTAKDCERR
jgi:hypothetical protein